MNERTARHPRFGALDQLTPRPNGPSGSLDARTPPRRRRRPRLPVVTPPESPSGSGAGAAAPFPSASTEALESYEHAVAVGVAAANGMGAAQAPRTAVEDGARAEPSRWGSGGSNEPRLVAAGTGEAGRRSFASPAHSGQGAVSPLSRALGQLSVGVGVGAVGYVGTPQPPVAAQAQQGGLAIPANASQLFEERFSC